MEYVQLLAKTCVTDISSCCSDYGIAMFLYIIKRVVAIIQLVVPILLLVMGSISFAQMVINPDDPQKAKSKSIMNKFFSAIIVFFTPYIINLIVGMIPNTYEIAGCWTAADDTVTLMNETEDYEAEVTKNPKKRYTVPKSKYQTNDKSINNDIYNNADDYDNTDNASASVKEKRKKVVKYAKSFVGKNYIYGGSWNGERPWSGTDCSGFVQGVYRHFGYDIPRTSDSQAAVTKYKKITPTKANLKKGDLIFYDKSSIHHVAMYIGGGQIVHASNSAPYPAGGVKISSYNYSPPAWARRIIS